eukprot:7069954-Prymnesium_polylepis.1
MQTQCCGGSSRAVVVADDSSRSTRRLASRSYVGCMTASIVGAGARARADDVSSASASCCVDSS